MRQLLKPEPLQRDLQLVALSGPTGEGKASVTQTPPGHVPEQVAVQ